MLKVYFYSYFLTKQPLSAFVAESRYKSCANLLTITSFKGLEIIPKERHFEVFPIFLFYFISSDMFMFTRETLEALWNLRGA